MSDHITITDALSTAWENLPDAEIPTDEHTTPDMIDSALAMISENQEIKSRVALLASDAVCSTLGQPRALPPDSTLFEEWQRARPALLRVAAHVARLSLAELKAPMAAEAESSAA